MKTALITGVTGQDGSYLAELLLAKGYEVHGIVRRSSSFNTERLESIYQDPHEIGRDLVLHYGDLADSVSLVNLLREIQPDEVYHLGAQSHVKVSFQIPEYTARGDRDRRDPVAGSNTCVEDRYSLLPGVELGNVRLSTAPAERTNTVPPAFALRCGQGVRILVDRELPGGVRNVRRQRDLVQS